MNNTYRDFYNIRILKDDGTIKEACIRREELDARPQQLIAASSQPIGQMPYPDSLKVVMPDGRVGYNMSAGVTKDDAEVAMATVRCLRHEVVKLETENASLRANCRVYEERASKARLAFQKIEAAMQELYGDD